MSTEPGQQCFIQGCGFTDIDERGPIRLRDGSEHRACTEHWEAIWRIVGRQVTWEHDGAMRWSGAAPADIEYLDSFGEGDVLLSPDRARMAQGAEFGTACYARRDDGSYRHVGVASGPDAVQRWLDGDDVFHGKSMRASPGTGAR